MDKATLGAVFLAVALAIQVAFPEMGMFQTSSAQVPIEVSSPIPLGTVQAIDNVRLSPDIGPIVSRPERTLSGQEGEGNGDLEQLETELRDALAIEIGRGEIAIRREPDGLVISLREVGFFERGSAQMKATSQPAFDCIAGLLRQRDYRVRIEGHTDNVSIHTAQFSSNWELSTARATEIVRLLMVREGFAPDRLSAAGYAEYHPIASNRTFEGRGMNRRVDIVILSRGKPAAPMAGDQPRPGQPSPPAGTKPQA